MFYLMSIHDNYASLILSGKKKVEIRKNRVHMLPNDYVAIYATKPLGRIIGYFIVDSVTINNRSIIWEAYKDRACILQEDYLQYTRDKNIISAIVIKKSVKQDGLCLADIGLRIPQSYTRISKKDFMRLCRMTSL